MAHHLSALQQAHHSATEELFLLVLCICNQYCIQVQKNNIEGFRLVGPELIHESGDPTCDFDNLECLHFVFGKMANVVHQYEQGDRSVKPDCTLQYLIEAFLWYFFCYVHESRQHHFVYNVYRKLHFWETTHVNSHNSVYDPTTPSSLLDFKWVMKRTNCLFAANSRIWGSPEYNKKKTLEENIQEAIPCLAKFLYVARHEHLDGFVLTISDEVYGDTVASLGATMKRVLFCLAKNDPTLPLSNCMEKDLDRTNWQFKFCEHPIFITSFAPCYPPTHPRYSFNATGIFILFQPEFSFGHHDIPRSDDFNPRNVRMKTRKNFEKHGRPYVRPTLAYPVAPLYVQHLDNFDVNAVFKWWKNE